MANPRDTIYTVAGTDGKEHKFTLKRTTKRNRDFVHAQLKEHQEQVTARAAELMAKVGTDEEAAEEVESEDEYSDLFDKFALDFKMFCWLTEGPHEIIDQNDFDIKLAEVARTDFLPESSRTMDVLLHFLKS